MGSVLSVNFDPAQSYCDTVCIVLRTTQVGCQLLLLRMSQFSKYIPSYALSLVGFYPCEISLPEISDVWDL